MDKMNAFGNVEEVLTSKDIKEPVFGIDLGTTNSAIAIVQSGTTPRVIKLDNGATTMPSCVQWKGRDNKFIVGMPAYKERGKPSVAYSTKRLMGSNQTITLKYGSKILEMRPEEVAAEVLKELVRQASSQFKHISKVIITVPAYFDDRQVSATIEAGKLAGLEVLGILREPTAAALVYENIAEDGSGHDVLIYDLGGGTFDVTALTITQDSGDSDDLGDIYGDFEGDSESSGKKIFSVRETAGDSKLGGDDIDEEMMKILLEKLKAAGVDTEAISAQDKGVLLYRLENIKKRGPGSYSFPVSLKINGKIEKHTIEINFSDFVRATRVIYNKTKKIMDTVLSRTGTNFKKITLVGGSTKSEVLRALLREDFPGVDINSQLNPDESVALGAAVKAKEQAYGDAGIEVFDILPMGIGVLSDGYVDPIIKRSQRVPCVETRVYSTTGDNQEEIHLNIYQGNSRMKEECTLLRKVVLKGIPQLAAGEVAVNVTMSVDSNGVLSVRANSGDASITAEVTNLFGSNVVEEKKLSVDERKLVRWESFAEKQTTFVKAEIMAAIEEYRAGNMSIAEVGKVVSRLSSEVTPVRNVERVTKAVEGEED